MAQKHTTSGITLKRSVNVQRDHVRGGGHRNTVNVVIYADFLCPYCRRLYRVMKRLRQTLGERLAYVFRHFPNERAHPGAEFIARATEAAAKQGRFWEMHDWLYNKEPPISQHEVIDFSRGLGLDMERFNHDLHQDGIRQRVMEDLTEGRSNGVSGTPTVFIDGVRYDGAWDYHSMLEAVEQPIAARVERSARVFASLPASGGLVLLVAAAVALICANTQLSSYYQLFIKSSFSIGPPSHLLSLTVGGWFSEGLLAIFFLLVGLEIRREITVGSLAIPRAAVLPVIAAIGGVIVPAIIYHAFNTGPTASGWSIPTSTDVAFTLGVLALLGDKIPLELRVFVAALAVIDDVLSVLTLAIFYPTAFEPTWLFASAVATALLFAFNRWRVYAAWPYVITAVALGLFLHATSVHAALAGVLLAAFLPTRSPPAVGSLLAQAATALAELEHAEHEAEETGMEQLRIEQQPIWEWAGRNLSAASERLLSPADRIEQAVAPWTAFLILPLFAFSATGVNLAVDLGSSEAHTILLGVIIGLVIGKPLGISLASLIAIKTRIALAPDGVTVGNFIGAACLCGIGDTVALLMADQAFPTGSWSAVAKIGVLIGSVLAALLGATILTISSRRHLVTVASS